MSDLAPDRSPDGGPPDPAFIGRGFSWPMGVDHTGSLAMTRGAEDLDRSIRVVLATAPGERVMRPEFGCKIWDLLYEPINGTTVGLMAHSVREAVTQWEPQVDHLEDVVVRTDDHDNGLVHITISYTIRTTNDRRNLVYPFYVIPREED